MGGQASHLRPCTARLGGHPHCVVFSTPLCICEVCKGWKERGIEPRPEIEPLINLGGQTSHLRPCTARLGGHPHRVVFPTPLRVRGVYTRVPQS